MRAFPLWRSWTLYSWYLQPLLILSVGYRRGTPPPPDLLKWTEHKPKVEEAVWCLWSHLVGWRKRESLIFCHLKFDVLGHVIDALLNYVVRETYLIKLFDTVLFDEKMSSLYHARFKECLSNLVWLLLLCSKKGDLVRCLENIASWKLLLPDPCLNWCSLILKYAKSLLACSWWTLARCS